MSAPGPERFEGRELVRPRGTADWRSWLVAHHAASPGAWLVTRRGPGGPPEVPYEAAVEEALCVGWIDSRRRSLDDAHAMQLFTPRRPGSGWAATNKARVERLLRDGRMLPAGLAVVEAARADGSWTLLDDVEALVEPADLAAALDAVPAARGAWDGFPPSARKRGLWHVVSAKRDATRAARIAETVRRAALGVRPDDPALRA